MKKLPIYNFTPSAYDIAESWRIDRTKLTNDFNYILKHFIDIENAHCWFQTHRRFLFMQPKMSSIAAVPVGNERGGPGEQQVRASTLSNTKLLLADFLPHFFLLTNCVDF